MSKEKKHYYRLKNNIKAINTRESESWKIPLFSILRSEGAFYTTKINSKECNHYFERAVAIVLSGDYDSLINVCITKKLLWNVAYLFQIDNLYGIFLLVLVF